MSEATGMAIAALVAGSGAGLWALLRIRSGSSYTSNPPMRVSRKEDPFAFWLSLLPLLAIAAVLIGGGASALLAG